jgi:hypothetical protein
MVACERKVSVTSAEEKLKPLIGQNISNIVVSENGAEITLITKEGPKFSFLGNRFGITVIQK